MISLNLIKSYQILSSQYNVQFVKTQTFKNHSQFKQRGLFALCRVAILGFSRTVPSVGRSLHRQIILSEIKYHYFHPLLSFPRQSSFPRRRESRKHRFYSEKTKSKAQTCGLIQRISQRLPHCVKSELVLNWFSHYLNSYIFFLLSFLRRQESRPTLDSRFHGNDRVWSFPRHLSFLRQLSFPRRRESRMLLSSDTAWFFYLFSKLFFSSTIKQI